MPGKYLEYIRAGRYVIPVELTFLPETGTFSSKWVEQRHWKEIKAMMKPVVDLVAKYNEANGDKISKSHHIAFGSEIAFGYIIHLNKDQCPFVSILDPKDNIWTDEDEDEEAETDSHSGLGDFGGRHTSYTPTKCYIKAVVLKKSESQLEDGKKLRKELGVKPDDVRNYFQPSAASSPFPGTSASALASGSASVEKKTARKRKKSSAKKPATTTPSSSPTNFRKSVSPKPKTNKPTPKPTPTPKPPYRPITIIQHRDYGSSSEESLMDLPPPVAPFTMEQLLPSSPKKLQLSSNSNANTNEPGAGALASVSSISDDLDDLPLPIEGVELESGNIFNDSLEDVFSTSTTNSIFRSWLEETDQGADEASSEEELLDIEETANSIPQPKKQRTKKKAPAPTPAPGALSISTGLPEIGEIGKGARSRSKKKRTVAVVGPMLNPRSSQSPQLPFFEEISTRALAPAPGPSPVNNGNERRKRNKIVSPPTIEQLLSGSGLNELLEEGSGIARVSSPSRGNPSPSRRNSSQSSRNPSPSLSTGGKKKSKTRKKKRQVERLTPSTDPREEEDHSPSRRNPSPSLSTGVKKKPKTAKKKKPPIERLTPSPFPDSAEERDSSPSRRNPSPSISTGGKKKPKIRKKKRPVELLTPSPFPDSSEEEEEEDHAQKPEDPEDSEVYGMPVLFKMVGSPNPNFLINTPPESPGEVEVPLLERQDVIVNPRAPPSPDIGLGIEPPARRRGPSPDISLGSITQDQDQHRARSRVPSPDISIGSSQQVQPAAARIRVPSPDIGELTGVIRIKTKAELKSPAVKKRARAASDSDDITSESAYRKAPLPPLKKKRRKKRPSSSMSLSNTNAHAPTPIIEQPQIEDTEEIPIVNPKLEGMSQYESGEDDDNDVLFDGQYTVISIPDSDPEASELVETAPPATNIRPEAEVEEEDDDEEDLFSFEKPARVKIEAQSINHLETEAVSELRPATTLSSAPNAEPEIAPTSPTPPQNSTGLLGDAQPESESDENDEISYSFDYSARSRLKHRANPLNPLNPLQRVLAMSHREVDADDEDARSLAQTVENLSTYELMNHPGTLSAGFGILHQVMADEGDAVDIYASLGLGPPRVKKKKKRATEPQTGRASSPDICELNPEKTQKRKKPKEPRKLGPGETKPKKKGQKVKKKVRETFRYSHELELEESSDESDGYPAASEPYFREFVSRTKIAGKDYEPQDDEFYLATHSQCMTNVVADYAEKSRQWKQHKKAIEEFSPDSIKMYFEVLRPQVLGIFNGSVHSKRNVLYCSNKHQDLVTLKSLYVILPFNEEHGNVLNSWLYDIFLPHSESTLRCADYINYVMRPECFIRLFAYVNKISCDTAEKELLAGPCYEGPYLEA